MMLASFSDRELELVTNAARSLPPDKRAEFMRRVVAALDWCTVCDRDEGEIGAAIATALRAMLVTAPFARVPAARHRHAIRHRRRLGAHNA
jgi:hypothetical protein